MNELRQEFANEKTIKNNVFSRQNLRLVILFLMVSVSAVYIGDLLFGQNSYSTILYLEDQRDALNKNIEILKQQNAKYQKEYFELKRIGGEK
jgi:cell division protein FtsB